MSIWHDGTWIPSLPWHLIFSCLPEPHCAHRRHRRYILAEDRTDTHISPSATQTQLVCCWSSYVIKALSQHSLIIVRECFPLNEDRTLCNHNWCPLLWNIVEHTSLGAFNINILLFVFVLLIDYMTGWSEGIDWQVISWKVLNCRNKLSSSIIRVDSHADESHQSSVLFRDVSMAGGGKAALIHFLSQSWGSNWKIWVALLVCFGGVCVCLCVCVYLYLYLCVTP